MIRRSSETGRQRFQDFPPLPLTPSHWKAICKAMRLSKQHAATVELLLRGMCNKQIAAAMGIAEPTVKTYLERIQAKIGARTRMGIAMHVLGVSHEVLQIDRQSASSD